MTHGPEDPPIRLSGWALILGASSGFGEATALALAGAGMSIVGVHLDRKATLPNAERIAAEVRRRGGEALFFNVNAADPERRAEVLDTVERELEARGQRDRLKVLLHSLAFGTLRPLVADVAKEAVTHDQMDMTLDVMAHSLVYWTQDVVVRGLMGPGRPHLRDDERWRHARAPELRAGLGRQGRARVPRAPARDGARPARHHGQRRPRRRHGHARAPEDPRRRPDQGRRPGAQPRRAPHDDGGRGRGPSWPSRTPPPTG